MSDSLELAPVKEDFTPDPQDVKDLAKRLDSLFSLAHSRRRYFHIRMRFDEGEMTEVQTYLAFPKITRASGHLAFDAPATLAFDKILATIERPLPLGWSFDAASLAEQLLYGQALKDPRLRTLAFRADFRRIADKKLFKCWIDAKHPQFKGSLRSLAATKSASATAAVAEAIGLATSAFSEDPFVLPEPENKGKHKKNFNLHQVKKAANPFAPF
jgi:hypothetical protein